MPTDQQKPWYHKGLRFKCTSCGNCCKRHGEYDRVYVAEADVTAIAAHLGLDRAVFLELHCYEENGWTLLRQGAEACPFLDEGNRCAIYPVRPKQCATWPFWEPHRDQRVWEADVVEICPGVGQGPLTEAAEFERIARETEEWYGA